MAGNTFFNVGGFSGLFSAGGSGGINLADYASIRNGSYKRLLKAYYAKEKAEKTGSSTTNKSKDTKQKTTLLQDGATALKKAADALNSSSLWEKKTMTTTNAETGEKTETEDYDWDAITKAVQSFVTSYNGMLDEAAKSDTTGVLKTTLWMTAMTAKSEGLLNDVGITIGTDNKLTLNADTLKKADISTLKTMFSGYNSYASKVSQKASSIYNAAGRGNGTYTNKGTYTSPLNSTVASKVDTEV